MPTNIQYVLSNGSNVYVANDTTGTVSIAVDYSSILANIAQSMFTISTGIQTVNYNLANIASEMQNVNINLANVNSNLINITSEIYNSNSTLSLISDDINIIRVLGNVGGVGYKTTIPYGWMGSTSLYQLYVEQGYALSNSLTVSAATQVAAIDKLKVSAQKMKDNLDEDI